MIEPIQAVVVDKYFMRASGLLNGNAFPPRVRMYVEGCAQRLATLDYAVEVVLREPALDRARLLREIRSNPSFNGFSPTPDKPVVLSLQNRAFLTGLFSALIASKSFLDLYAKVMSRSIVPSTTARAFSKGKRGAETIAGGAFLNWLEKSTGKNFANRSHLIESLEKHVNDWADEAVTYRDHVAHDGEIPSLGGVIVPLNKALVDLMEADIRLPRMPHGEFLSDYCERLRSSVRRLVQDTAPLLPEVDPSLLSFEG